MAAAVREGAEHRRGRNQEPRTSLHVALLARRPAADGILIARKVPLKGISVIRGKVKPFSRNRTARAVIARLCLLGNPWLFGMRTLRTRNAISVAADGLGTDRRAPAA